MSPDGPWSEAVERLVLEIGPTRALVLGPGGIALAAALTSRGVQTDTAPAMGSRWDLVVLLDPVRDLDHTDAPRICAAVDDVLVVPSRDDERPRSTWIAWFSHHGLAVDPAFDARFLGHRALRFRRAFQATEVVDTLLAERDVLLSELEGLRLRVRAHETAAVARERTVEELRFHLLAVQASVGWKLLSAVRRARDVLFPGDSRRHRAWVWARARVGALLDRGAGRDPAGTAGHDDRGGRPSRLAPRSGLEDDQARYQVWLTRESAAARALPGRRPLVSVVTPVHDPDERWLRRAVESVLEQTYADWELCLVNDASVRPHVAPLLDEFAARDPRIRVAHLAVRAGIAGASNHGLSLATGEFVALLDHDDELAPAALLEMVGRIDEDPGLDLLYSDEDKLDEHGCRVEPFFKPDWSPDLLLSTNYVCHLSVFRRSVLESIGGFRTGFDGSQDHDLLLRFTERTARVAHIPRVLYHWRQVPGSAATSIGSKPYAHGAGRRALEEALRRRALGGRVDTVRPGHYAIRYRLRDQPLVSIIVLTRDRGDLLRDCLRSVEGGTTYPRYEIVVVDNGSTEPDALETLRAIEGRWRVLRAPGPFNFSALNNLAAGQARGDYLLFLNNDTRVVRADWLTALLEQAQRPEVGAVGAKLLYPDGRIQHAGVVLGLGGLVGHAFRGSPDDGSSYRGLADLVRNCSAVTGACLMTRRQAFEEAGAFDERLGVALNDVDLCLRLRARGYLVVYTPMAVLHHLESASRGSGSCAADEARFLERWAAHLRDPYYNPNLSLAREDWGVGP